MKRTVVLTMMAAVLALGVSPGMVASETSKSAQIPWVSSFDSALQLAKQQNKPIFMDFYNPK